jgi:hypothetical protein
MDRIVPGADSAGDLPRAEAFGPESLNRRRMR